MQLQDLGFDAWFQEKGAEMRISDHRVARVTAVDRERYLVRNENVEVPAELTGRLRYSAASTMDLPAVGDWVLVQLHNDDALAIIHSLFPRRSLLRRKSAGRKIEHQLIASNIDTAFIVQSCDVDFNLRRMDRYLVMINEGHIEPMILLSKSDLIRQDELGRRFAAIRSAGIDSTVIAFSNETGSGLDQVREVLQRGKTYCLLGSSGVGKTTLLNRLVGRNEFATDVVREHDGKGKHTTTRRQLIALDQGAMLIDTPGMRELANIGASDGIEESFPDIKDMAAECRFTDCTHTREDGCSVLMALERGELSEERYRSYLKLVRESEYHQMSYFEKRQKDKKLGRFIKSVMKHKRK